MESKKFRVLIKVCGRSNNKKKWKMLYVGRDMSY